MPNEKPNEPATQKVTVTLTLELVRQLDEVAARDRRTRSSALRVLLEDALRRLPAA